MSLKRDLDGYLDNDLLAPSIVLGVADAVRQFVLGLAQLPIEREADPSHYISDAFSYMQDPHEATEYIEHFQWEVSDRLSLRYEAWVVERFLVLLSELCKAIHSALVHAGAWDANNAMWYTFDRLEGYEVILRRVDGSGDHY